MVLCGKWHITEHCMSQFSRPIFFFLNTPILLCRWLASSSVLETVLKRAPCSKDQTVIAVVSDAGFSFTNEMEGHIYSLIIDSIAFLHANSRSVNASLHQSTSYIYCVYIYGEI